MFTGHVHNRRCGATASQAFVEYFVQLHDKPKSAWNVARVGSIEFTGSVIIGNVHWVSSSDESGHDPEVRKYHMTRVMCHFTYGLGFQNFKKAYKETPPPPDSRIRLGISTGLVIVDEEKTGGERKKSSPSS
jgi:hypothetical protein